MNKSDIKLVIFMILIAICALVIMKSDNNGKVGKVYYNGNLILTIDLNIKEEKKYQVIGYNGEITIVSNNGKLQVIEENSPLHLCSKQGYISHSYESIVCLPNKIVIKIESDDSLDTIVE